MRENLFLIGFMGTGKTTVASALRRSWHMKQIEMDRQIEKEQGMKISAIFSQEGEDAFRKMETDLLEHLEPDQGLVVSCGGGVPMREENVALMHARGKIVYLTASPQTIYHRVSSSHHRPLLEGNMNVDYIKELMDKRAPYYAAAADITVSTDGKSAMAIAREIQEKL